MVTIEVFKIEGKVRERNERNSSSGREKNMEQEGRDGEGKDRGTGEEGNIRREERGKKSREQEETERIGKGGGEERRQFLLRML